MLGKPRRAVPLRLMRAAAQFAEWRRTRGLGRRIPERLWAAAVRLAVTYGLCPTARTLKLDYYSLKRRVEEQGSKSAATHESVQTPGFVELSASMLAAPGECVIEFENPAGSRMRVFLKGAHVPDLVALGTSFWSAQ